MAALRRSLLLVLLLLVCLTAPGAQAVGADVRLTNDDRRWLCQRLHARHRPAYTDRCPDSVPARAEAGRTSRRWRSTHETRR